MGRMMTTDDNETTHRSEEARSHFQRHAPNRLVLAVCRRTPGVCRCGKRRGAVLMGWPLWDEACESGSARPCVDVPCAIDSDTRGSVCGAGGWLFLPAF